MSSEMVSTSTASHDDIASYHITISDPNHGDPSLRPDFAVIPLALSERGIKAIAGAGIPGLLNSILANSRPIYTRLIHTRGSTGKHTEIPMKYGPQGEACIYCLDVPIHTELQFSAFTLCSARR